MADDTSVFERLVGLVKRELQADDVRLLSPGEAPPEADNVLVSRLPDGRHVVASFGSPPRDRDALERRLSMLASTFSDALATPPSEKSRVRPPVATSLHEELKALAVRARAHAVVVDTDSPVIWGCASSAARPRDRGDLLLRDVSDGELRLRSDDAQPPLKSLQDVAPEAAESAATLRDSQPVPAESAQVVNDESADAPVEENETTRLAILAVRRLPALDGLHKGRHLRHVERDQTYLLALSFSGIYILCLVFEGDFDELRADRAATDALPRIERLVLALPPLDPGPPTPMGGVVALSGRRRR
jgi:hypothetical protein